MRDRLPCSCAGAGVATLVLWGAAAIAQDGPSIDVESLTFRGSAAVDMSDANAVLVEPLVFRGSHGGEADTPDNDTTPPEPPAAAVEVAVTPLAFSGSSMSPDVPEDAIIVAALAFMGAVGAAAPQDPQSGFSEEPPSTEAEDPPTDGDASHDPELVDSEEPELPAVVVDVNVAPLTFQGAVTPTAPDGAAAVAALAFVGSYGAEPPQAPEGDVSEDPPSQSEEEGEPEEPPVGDGDADEPDLADPDEPDTGESAPDDLGPDESADDPGPGDNEPTIAGPVDDGSDGDSPVAQPDPPPPVRADLRLMAIAGPTRPERGVLSPDGMLRISLREASVERADLRRLTAEVEVANAAEAEFSPRPRGGPALRLDIHEGPGWYGPEPRADAGRLVRIAASASAVVETDFSLSGTTRIATGEWAAAVERSPAGWYEYVTISAVLDDGSAVRPEVAGPYCWHAGTFQFADMGACRDAAAEIRQMRESR